MKKPLADEKINWGKSIPYFVIHLLPLGIFFTGISWFSVGLCVATYATKMFFVTAGYHRYFSHRSYKLNRFWQFLMALGGTLAIQKGPLWWAAHHRAHHQHSDTELDAHTPTKGFWWSHMGWVLSDKYRHADLNRVPEFMKFAEIRFINKYPYIFPAIIATGMLLLWGPQGLFVGFFLPTVLCWHVTYCINSMAHKIGSRRFVTEDTSRNFLPLAILTGGEGWHNNHHYFQSSARQGFYWWEVDFTYYVLKILSWVGIVKDLITPPKEILVRNRIKDGLLDIGMFKEHWRNAGAVVAKTMKQTKRYYNGKSQVVADAMKQTKGQAEELVRLAKRQKARSN